MKRWVIFSCVSVATFLFGCAVVLGLRLAYPPESHINFDVGYSEGKSESNSVTTDVAFDSGPHLETFDDEAPANVVFSCRLLQPGPAYHTADIEAKDGEKWLGLFKNNGRFSIRPATVAIKSVPDELLHGPSSDRKGKLTGKSVSVKNDVEPLFLVKNSSRLRPGSVATLFEGEREDWKNDSVKPTFLDKNFKHTYELAGNVYELKVVKAKNRRVEPILALILEGDGKRQLIHTFWPRGEGEYGEKNWLGSVGTLYWAGDLDKDGKPDFYLSLYAHEIIYEAYLLLSSESDEDKLVKKAAIFGSSGCG